MLLGQKIKEIRKDKGLSLRHLAHLTDMSKSYLWEIEDGKYQGNISAEKLLKLSNVLDTTIDYLVKDESSLGTSGAGQDFLRKFSRLSLKDKKRITYLIDRLAR